MRGPKPSTSANSNVAEMRMRWGWSIRELARRSGLAVGTICNVEKRKSPPRKETIRRLAYTLRCPQSWLAEDQPYYQACECCGGTGKTVAWPYQEAEDVTR